VVGGEGPPLLLVHGWPENWYAWRLLMPALARDYEVIAVDQRGIGLSDKPTYGYDAGSMANDLIALMDVIGHERFAAVGHDTGFVISYALAADHADRVDRVALAEIPGRRCRLTHRRCSSSRSPTTGSGRSPSIGSRRCPSS
jgi:pimeloyl-ACP methyl ester carboxylesterase